MNRRELEIELERVKAEESLVNTELREYFQSLSAPKSIAQKRLAFDSIDLGNSVAKIESYTPSLEVIAQDSRKLVNQIEECRQLSDRLSIMVRRLDLMQMRAQEALACTEDIINLKESKSKLSASVDEKNLPQAVFYIRQVHAIDSNAVKSSDDYEAIEKLENQTRILVKEALNEAMEASDINSVVTLCPLFQTLGLEVEARDSFLSFMEKSVFIAVSADAAVSEAVTDAATGYAQALSNVFNSTYIILQKYLALVIQGMENSLGDVLFIRKLHVRCEKEAGTVMKRYMKYRSIKQVIDTIKTHSSSHSTAISANGTSNSLSNTTNSKKEITSSELHVILDELAILIQYCCLYAKYLKNLCSGAESRKRNLVTTSMDVATIILGQQAVNSINLSNVNLTTSDINKLAVFHGPTEFDKMISELVDRYYMEGEQYLLHQATRNTLPKSIGKVSYSEGSAISTSESQDDDISALDESFYVLQRCGLRAIATHNIHAACSVLHLISDLLISEVKKQANDYLNKALQKIGSIFQEHMNRYTKSIHSMNSSGQESSAVTISKGLKSAISLASSLTSTAALSSTVGVGNMTDDINDYHSLYDNTFNYNNQSKNDDDPWHTAIYVQAFEVIEKCIRYTDRLSHDIMHSAENVFVASSTANSNTANENKAASSTALKSHHHETSNPISNNIAGEMDKIKLCKEDFDKTKIVFQQVLHRGIDKLVSYGDAVVKDLLSFNFSKQGPLGGLKFDLEDDKFDEQPALAIFPKSLVTPMETMLSIVTFGLSDSNKDMLISLLVDKCVERLEHYINQSTFRFAGAIKFEECIRAVTSLFTRTTTSSVRGKFARLREIMVVLTSDLSSPGSISAILADNFTHLTTNDVNTYLALRLDNQTGSE